MLNNGLVWTHRLLSPLQLRMHRHHKTTRPRFQASLATNQPSSFKNTGSNDPFVQATYGLATVFLSAFIVHIFFKIFGISFEE